ncbi:MAG TPA: hypothetical protein VNW68_02100 [Candidatus Limnocylindria bacterium]|nr:hypothetical protein [Candidatus Limnocylindria bacterium]
MPTTDRQLINLTVTDARQPDPTGGLRLSRLALKLDPRRPLSRSVPAQIPTTNDC